jgi:Telomere-binding protein beta subunit (TEBP beta)
VITKWECELALTNSAEEFTSYGGIEMRIIIHDFKVKLEDQVKMSKYPANLYRDDDVKTHLLSFIAQQRLAPVIKASEADQDLFSSAKPKTSSSPSTARSLNTLNIASLDSHMSLYQLSADDDLFQDFTFLSHSSKASIVPLQEIFVQEKGAEALRAQNINYLHNQRREEPNLEKKDAAAKLRNAASEHEESGIEVVTKVNNGGSAPAKKGESATKVKKSLKVDKEIKVTTTIVKAKPQSKATDKKKAQSKSKPKVVAKIKSGSKAKKGSQSKKGVIKVAASKVTNPE